MKTLLAALALRAHASDETSLMQGLARRMDGKLGTGGSHDTTKLMETATKMLKNGAAATPDVAQFLLTTTAQINVTLDAVRAAHDLDQGLLDAHKQEFDRIVSHCDDTCVDHSSGHGPLTSAKNDHHECRQSESLKCGESRRCEVDLRQLWQHVVTHEQEMRRIHHLIEEEICVPASCEDIPTCTPDHEGIWTRCWDWTIHGHYEGAETSVSFALRPDAHYPLPDTCDDVLTEKRNLNILYGQYLSQKIIVEHAWELYNIKIGECATLEIQLEGIVERCDTLNNALKPASCELQQSTHDLNAACDRDWRQEHAAYLTTVGSCDPCSYRDTECLSIGDDTDDCQCGGVQQMEFERKMEWHTLNIVYCLLDTVYTHVIHAIETNEPCPTETSHPEQTYEQINFCHVFNWSTEHLNINYCGDDLECPAPPQPCDTPDTHCSSSYNYNTIGHFGQHTAVHTPALTTAGLTEEYNVDLSEWDWGGCAAPIACELCTGQGDSLDYSHYGDSSVDCEMPCTWCTCMVPQPDIECPLITGQTTLDRFRCHDGQITAINLRCNGHNNCLDGSDELGCNEEDLIGDTGAPLPVDVQLSSVCPVGSAEALGVQDDVHFFCNDGTCIPVEGRCNGFYNCADQSDEAGCSAGVGGVLVEPTSGHPASIETIRLGEHTFNEREYTFESVGSFTGMSFLKVSNEDKSTPHTNVQTKLRLSQPLTVYILTQHDPLTGSDQTLGWLAHEGWTEDTSLTGPEYGGERITPAKEWLQSLGEEHRDAIDKGLSHYSTAKVYKKTFPAGVVHLRGNGGGEGYNWASGVDGGHGSYLVFIAHPSHTPVEPEPEPAGDCRLQAYWEYHSCGCGGNDQNANWCGGIGSGDCPNTVSVDTSICPSGTAHLAEWHPKTYSGGHQQGHSSHLVVDGCEFIWHAQYACQPALGATSDGCPSDNNNSGNYQDGPVGDLSGELIPFFVSQSEADTASVRCCSMAGDACETSSLEGGCPALLERTFAEAQEVCSTRGMRLCSRSEMDSNICCNSGCWFNHHSVWVTTE